MIQPETFYLRDPRFSIVSRRNTSWISLGEGEERRPIATYDDARLAALMPYVTVPITGKDLRMRLGPRTDLLALVPKLVHDGLLLTGTKEALMEHCKIIVAPPPERVGTMVLGITGGIYASLLMPFLYQLPSTLCDKLEVVVTDGAKNFINPGLFKFLGHMGIRVFEGTYDSHDGVHVPHVELARTAELVVIFPATAHSLSRFAQGECSDLISLVVTATRAPVVMLPVMNVLMWTNPSVARNVERLRSDGHYIVEPGMVAAISRRELDLMYGGPGVRWDRAEQLISLLSSIVGTHRRAMGIPPGGK
jgi:phosphopantothenoylcysteine decarboxylase/phosphopantothenate--cysteine ligase